MTTITSEFLGKGALRTRGWTQEQLAEKLDVATETVSRYEGGRLPLSLTMLYVVADKLAVTVESLMGNGPPGLTEEERELLERWRGLDKRGQTAILDVLRGMGR